MMTRIDLKQVEQKAHRTFQQDGLNILFAGIALGIIAVFFIDVRHGWVFALGITLAVSMPAFFRRQLVHPRIGYAQFPRSKAMVRHIAAICLAVVCLILFYALGKTARFNWLMPLYLGTVFSAAALVAAMKSGLAVYYVMSLVLLLSGFTGLGFTMRGYRAGWVVAFQLWALAVILTFVGLVQLLCFLRKYPMRPVEDANEKG